MSMSVERLPLVNPVVEVASPEPLPVIVWLILGSLALLTFAGAGFSAFWLATASPDQLSSTSWLFICH